MSDEIQFDENWNVIEPGSASTNTIDDEDMDIVVDANGTPLSDGDSIIAIKGLPVKGGTDIKKWQKYTNIRLTDYPTHISVNTKQNGKIFLKTEFFKLSSK